MYSGLSSNCYPKWLAFSFEAKITVLLKRQNEILIEEKKKRQA
jgi:hypothetical protein